MKIQSELIAERNKYFLVRSNERYGLNCHIRRTKLNKLS